jgi:hypothetical protein
MSISYLNTKIYGQVETLDQLDSSDFKDYKAFRAEKKRLLGEYVLAGGHGAPYWSRRSTKAYKGA